MIAEFQQIIAIDWSGARGPRLPGLQVATCSPGDSSPRLVYPDRAEAWTRRTLFDFLPVAARERGPVFAGFDMSVAFPFCDLGCYFPGLADSPPDAGSLWRSVDDACRDASDFYGRPYTAPGRPVAEYFNAPGYRGRKYDTARLRITDRQCLRWTRPSSVFNGVGPGSVGTGSLAGMRFFHAFRKIKNLRVAIWPFDPVKGDEHLVLCEIFPRLYVKQAGIDPRTWREPGFTNRVLRCYGSQPVRSGRFTEDEIDALVSAAALRTLAKKKELWHPAAMTRKAARHEGWIFGVT